MDSSKLFLWVVLNRYLYSAAFYLLIPFILMRLCWRAIREPAYLVNLKHRFGFVPWYSEPVIWIHAVSAGETIATAPLVERLLIKQPGYRVLVTNMTPTGRDRVKALFAARVDQAYAPYDLPGAVKRFLKRVTPQLLIIIDTELWPNMLHFSREKNITSILVNGRLSEKSAKGYAKISSLTTRMLADISQVAVQTQSQGDRFLALGLPEEKLSVTGSIKFDLTLPGDFEEKKTACRERVGEDRLLLVAGSTHKGEEDALLQSISELTQNFPQLLLILAPRHPHRFAEVEALLKKSGLSYATFSSSIPCHKDTRVLLIDVLGELLHFYSLADIAFIGGSLVPVGGHNLMEAGVFGVPILMGEYIRNVEDIANQFSASGALKLVTKDQLTQQIEWLLADPKERSSRGDRALEVMALNQGALDRVEEIIYRLYLTK